MSNEIPSEFTISFPKAAIHNLPDALSELLFGISHAQQALDHIQDSLCRSAASDPDLTSIIVLASLGLKRLAENEGNLLLDLENTLRRAASRMTAEDRAGEEKERKS